MGKSKLKYKKYKGKRRATPSDSDLMKSFLEDKVLTKEDIGEIEYTIDSLLRKPYALRAVDVRPRIARLQRMKEEIMHPKPPEEPKPTPEEKFENLLKKVVLK